MKGSLIVIKLALMSYFLFCDVSIKAQTWIPLDHDTMKCVSTRIIESTTSGYQVEINLHGFYDETIVAGDSVFHHLMVDEGTSLCRVGEPALPVISELIAIPDGKDYRARIIEGEWKTLDIGCIYPAQCPVKGVRVKTELDYEQDVYSAADYRPTAIDTSKRMNWRGIDNVGINVCPFVYHPLSGQLDVLCNFILQVDFVRSERHRVPTRKLPIGNGEGDIFSNSNILPEIIGNNFVKDISKSSSDNYDYLIIAGNIYGITTSKAMKDFMRWKAFKGLRTKIVSTSVTGTTDTAIKNYIVQESLKGIRYVLFIGDDDKIPLHIKPITNEGTAKSDYWYGCLDGEDDDIADIAVGRFPTNDLTELQRMVNKTMKYESQGKPYYNKVLLVAHHGTSDYNFISASESIRTGLYQEQLAYTRCYGAHTVFGGTNATNDTLLQAINSGYNIINYQGHGLYDRWNEWSFVCGTYDSFTPTNLSSIADSVCSVVWSLSCLTGDIKNQTCLMESMLRMDHGAVAYLGATESVYAGINEEFNLKLFKGLLNSNTYHIGDLVNRSDLLMLSSSGYFYRRLLFNVYSYICGGNPSLEIWTGEPQSAGNVLMWKEGNNIHIIPSAMSDFTYSVTDENGNLIETVVPTNGICTVAKPTTRCYVTLNKHNYQPYVILIDSREMFIQNKTFDHSALYLGAIYGIGYDVYNGTNYGDVIIKSGNTLKIISDYDVKIKNGFECEKGATLEIKL